VAVAISYSSGSIVGNSDAVPPAQPSGSMPIRSFAAAGMRCLQPRYRSAVCFETCPRRNRICSSSLPAEWQSRAHVHLRSYGASLISWDDVSKPVKLTVRRGGDTSKITYSPRGRTVGVTPRYVLDQARYYADPQGCEASSNPR
jgi:hypothetical protein